jgi:hypothetical protein
VDDGTHGELLARHAPIPAVAGLALTKGP